MISPLCTDYLTAENKNRQPFATPICCHNSANQIDNNHKSIASSEHKYPVHYLDVLGKNPSNRKNRRLSPTQHQHNHHQHHHHQQQPDCECSSLHARKSSEYPTAKPCHSENRNIIKVAHKFNSNVVHSIGDQSWVDANKVNGFSGTATTTTSDFHVNKAKFHCLDYDQCCYCCYSECKKGSRFKAAHHQCDDHSIECSQSHKSPLNLCCIGNDIVQAHLNNNCKSYKNQNNDQNSFCKSDTTAETDILEGNKCLVHDNSYNHHQHQHSAQFYVDYAIQPSTLRNYHSDKCGKYQKRLTDPTTVANQTPLNYLRRVQSTNENCSDCIGQLDKTFIKHLKRFQSIDQSVKNPTTATEPATLQPIVVEDQQKLVCCTRNVTAVRKTATLFMIGNSDSSNFVGSQPRLKDKSELVRDDDFVDTCQQNSVNSSDLKTQYNRNIDRCCEPYKSIDSKIHRLTSISAHDESHSKPANERNQIINYKLRADRTHKQLNSDCAGAKDSGKSQLNDKSDEQRQQQQQQQQQNHNGRSNDTFDTEGVNGDNGEYLCHLEKLNLADTTTVCSVAVTAEHTNDQQFKQKVAHISSTYRDNGNNDTDNGATTTHTTPAAPSLMVENERFPVDKSKQSEHQVNCIECTDQSASTAQNRWKIIEPSDYSAAKSVKTCGKVNSELNINKNDDNDKNSDFRSSGQRLPDENLVLSASTVNTANEECTLFEHKPIQVSASAENQNRQFTRRASYDNNSENEKELAIFVNHRRTNSSGDEGYLFDRQSKFNRSYIEAFSDRYRNFQATIEHRYAQQLSPNTVSKFETCTAIYRRVSVRDFILPREKIHPNRCISYGFTIHFWFLKSGFMSDFFE